MYVAHWWYIYRYSFISANESVDYTQYLTNEVDLEMESSAPYDEHRI